jgi:ATP-dependent helicase HrpB
LSLSRNWFTVSLEIQSLPIDAVLAEVVGRLGDAPNLVISAAPGAGKTTRVPPALIAAPWLAPEARNLVLLQPRRVAARASAARIADEQGWRLGEDVGYHVRFDRRIRDCSRIRVLTEGILTRQLIRDPYLRGIGAVILDEFHERSLDVDLALAFLKEIQETVREDLRIVVMSATLDVGPIVRYLDRCGVVECPGTLHPIEIRHRPAVAPAPLPLQVRAALEDVLQRGDQGDVLVFLPGMEEIRRVSRELQAIAKAAGLLVLPLHGSLSAAEQDRALRPARQRKVVLATNVAETSLTIEGVHTVIDSGLARVASHDPARGLDRLQLERISLSSATQRAGRAGRLGPGICYRLWGLRDERGMARSDAPEVARVDLAAATLAVHSWGTTDARRFAWFEAPSDERLAGADRLLRMLGAIDSERKLAPIGRELLTLPVHPRLGRLLLEARRFGVLREGATLAAILSEKDFTRNDAPPAASIGTSDMLRRLDLFAEAEGSPRPLPWIADGAIIGRIASTRDQLLRAMRHEPNEDRETDEEILLRLLLVAYPDRVAKRRGPGDSAGVMVGGKGVRIDSRSVVRDGEYFLALDPRDDPHSARGEARVTLAALVRLEWIEDAFPEAVHEVQALEFDSDRQRVVAVSRRYYEDLLLCENFHLPVDPGEAGPILAEALKGRAEAIFRENEGLSRLLERLEFARHAVPERSFPVWTEESTAGFLAAVCEGKRSMEDVARSPLAAILQARLGYDVMRELDAIAPEALSVPSGNRIRLAYTGAEAPVLAVRVQELFGLRQTPRVALDRVAVRLHLLGPNYRSVQITDDLPSFWRNTYPQVRKDLRARYPKHSWPEDPLTAKAESKGGRRSS